MLNHIQASATDLKKLNSFLVSVVGNSVTKPRSVDEASRVTNWLCVGEIIGSLVNSLP